MWAIYVCIDIVYRFQQHYKKIYLHYNQTESLGAKVQVIRWSRNQNGNPHHLIPPPLLTQSPKKQLNSKRHLLILQWIGKYKTEELFF